MIWKLSEKIWYGDKPSVVEAASLVKSIINVAHSIRSPYWQDLQKLDWWVWYFRLALPDREKPEGVYIRTLGGVVDCIAEAMTWHSKVRRKPAREYVSEIV